MLAYECEDQADRGATMQGKQAKIVSPTQERAILGYLATTRYPARDRVMFLLSLKAGLRAKEMASLTWAMVTDAAGHVAEVMHVPNRASKGKTGGRTIPLHPDLHTALVALQRWRADMATPERSVLFSERGGGLSPATWGRRGSMCRAGRTSCVPIGMPATACALRSVPRCSTGPSAASILDTPMSSVMMPANIGSPMRG
jgi:integrase